MVLGGAALVVDRCILTPSVTMPASVAASDVKSPARPPAAAAVPPDAPLSIPELPFPRGIPTWDPRAPIRDLFAPHSGGSATDKARSTSSEDAAKGTCVAFTKDHRLDAVLLQERLKIAIVDGVWVRIGESVDGCVLSEIVGNKVRFLCRDGDVVLTLSPRG